MQTLISTSTNIVKKSKFIAYIYKIDNDFNLKEIISNLKEEHKGCKHIIYAYVLNNQAGKSDDKEPSGCANSILSILNIKKMDNILVIVVRFFGGTLLGASNLQRAYKNTFLDALKKVKE